MNLTVNLSPSYYRNLTGRNLISFGQNKITSAKIDNTNNSAPKDADVQSDALEYEKEAVKLCKDAYIQKQEAERILHDAVEIMDSYKITGYKPVNKKEYYDSGKVSCELVSRCASSESDGTNLGVDYIYDTVLKKYGKNGKIKKEIVFSRIPNPDKYNLASMQNITDKPFIRSVKEYDEYGKLKRKTEGSFKDISSVKSITLYDNGNKKVHMSFDDGRLSNYLKGDFVQKGNVLRCPTVFEFDNNKLNRVKRNLTYYGFNIINCETFNFENGSFSGYEKHKHSLYD